MPAAARYAIIADDLTGACDAAAPLAARGLWTVVGLEPRTELPHSADVLAVCTNTRGETPEAAAERVREAIRSLDSSTARRFFKKIDSTLLGNIAYECDAAMHALGMAAALLAPAFPEMGRTVVDGVLHVAGVSSSRSIARVLREQGQTSCHTISLNVVRDGPSALLDCIAAGRTQGYRWFAVDSAVDDDLATVCAVVTALGSEVLTVCSGGLLRVMSQRTPTAWRSWVPTPSSGQGVVAFVGSTNDLTRRQVAKLVSTCGAIEFSATGASNGIAAAIAKGRMVVIPVAWTTAEAAALESVLVECARGSIGGVIATGGDTVRLICRLAHCSHLIVEGESSPGVPRGAFGDGLLEGTPLVTKAGGFGDVDAFVWACRQLQDPASMVVGA